MSKRETLRKLKKEEKLTKLERNLYLLSSILFLTTIIINILNILYAFKFYRISWFLHLHI